MEREKVYDFVKDMQENCSIMNEFVCVDKDDKDMYFKGVRTVLKALYINDLIRYSDLIKIESVID